MADMMKIVLVGAAAWIGYEYFLKPATGAVTPGVTPIVPTIAPPGTTPAAAPNPNAIVGANTIDGVYAKIAALGLKTGTIDDWNFQLMQVIPNYTAPDPMPIFSAAIPGFDRSQKITLDQYWAVMKPTVKTSAGLSGLGPRGLGWMAERRYF